MVHFSSAAQPSKIRLQSLAQCILAILLSLIPILSIGSPLTTGYLGSPTPDLYDHIFLFEWSRQSPWAETLSFSTQKIAGPVGGAIVMPDPLGGFAYSLFRSVFGQAFAFNLTLMSGLGAGAAAAFLLVRSLNVSGAASLLAAVIYGGSAFAYAQIHNGETETLQLFAIPLCLWAVRRSLNSPGNYASAMLAGLCIALTFWACWYYGAYLLLALTLYSLFYVLPRNILRGQKEILRSTAIAASIAALLIFPLAFALYGALFAGDSLFVMPTILQLVREDYLSLASSSADLASLVKPSSLAGHRDYIHGGYIGSLSLIMATTALILRPQKAAPWLGLGLAFLVLSLGPLLFQDGTPITLFGQFISLPYLFFAEVVPFFQALRLPYRSLILVQLAVAVLAALAVDHLLKTRGPLLSTIVCFLLGCACIVDLMVFSGLPAQASLVQVQAHPLKDSAPQGGILDLPMRFLREDLRGEYIAMQPSHGAFIPYSLMSTQLAPEYTNNPFLIEMAALDGHNQQAPTMARYGSSLEHFQQKVETVLFDPGYSSSKDIMKQGIEELKRLGLSKVVVHKRHLNTSEIKSFSTFLKQFLGTPSTSTSEALIYDL